MACSSGHNRRLVGGAIDAFLDSLRRRRYSPKTLEIYGLALREFAAFLEDKGIEEIRGITVKDVERYRLALVGRQLAPATVDLYLRALRRFFGRLEQTREIFLNPAAGLSSPRYKRKLLPVPSEEEVLLLLAQPDTSRPIGFRNRTLMETAYGTGCRVQELQRLSVNDVDLTTGTLRVHGKGGKERVVPLGTEACLRLSRYIGEIRGTLLKNPDEPALWINKDGGALSYAGTRVVFRVYSKLAGVNIACHAVRRACATHMLERGAHPVALQNLLGHASLRCLSQYLQLSITELKRIHSQTRPGR